MCGSDGSSSSSMYFLPLSGYKKEICFRELTFMIVSTCGRPKAEPALDTAASWQCFSGHLRPLHGVGDVPIPQPA